MEVLKTKSKLKSVLKLLKEQNKSVGFVPTMGALHQGHLSLVKKALSENSHVVVSIFVNPTQFDKNEDLVNYPRTLAEDTELLNTVSEKIIVFSPSAKEIYSENVASERFSFDGLEFEMEGKFRDGHFDGVGTILKKFFEIIMPNNAYFGEKDFQQFRIVQKLVEKLDLPINIIGCDIYRESHGLAMSSRNERLSKDTRQQAAFIYKTLLTAKNRFVKNSANEVKKWVIKEFEKHPTLDLEYIEIANIKTLKPLVRKSKNQKYRAFIAVFADNIRLIDNIALN